MQITKYRISSDKISKLKIVLISDLHDRPFDAVSQALFAEKPDLIALAGDITNKRLTVNERNMDVFKTCAEAAPSFFSRGNHEWMFTEEDRALCEQTGVVYLDNEYVHFGEIFVGGLSSGFRGRACESQKAGHEPETLWLHEFSREDGYKVLISHHPKYYPQYIKSLDIDLTLSGHAHGGQIRLFDRGVFYPDGGLFPDYTKGVYENRLVVGAGLSNTAKLIPRLNNPTELVIIEVGKEV